MTEVRITNHRPALLKLPDPVMLSEGKAGDMPRITGIGGGHRLIPGGNNIPSDAWTIAKNHKVIKEWLRLNWISEGGNTEEPEGPKSPESLTGYSGPTAIALAESESQVDVLKRWLKLDSRIEVTSVIKRRLEALGVKGPGRPRKSE